MRYSLLLPSTYLLALILPFLGNAQEQGDSEIRAILAAEGSEREQRIVRYLEERAKDKAIYPGRYAELRALGGEGIDHLRRWARQAPRTTLLGDRFRWNCVRALRDVVERTRDEEGHLTAQAKEVLSTLAALADDVLETDEIRTESVYALAQFGSRERLEKKLSGWREQARSDQVLVRARANNLLAHAHYDLREYEQAVTFYEAALQDFDSGELDPASAIAMGYNCACCLALSGRVDRGFEVLGKALEANRVHRGGLDRKLLETDRDLEKLRSDDRFGALLDRYFPDRSEKSGSP